MSSFRRTAAAGLALALTGLFIGAPARGAVADTSQNPHKALAPATSTAASAAAGYKSFSSTAESPGRTRTAAADRAVPASAVSPKAGASSVIYVEHNPKGSCSDPGAGTADDPFCLLQSAVDAAVSGDTIAVFQYDDERTGYTEDVSIVGKAGITIVGEGDGVGDYGSLDIADSSNITVRNMVFEVYRGNTVALSADQNITLDSDYFLEDGTTLPVVEISGTNSGIDVTRTSISGAGDGSSGVQIEAGASKVVLASDLVSSTFGLSSTSATNVDIVGNTIQAGCRDVTIAGTSTGTSIENNVFEPASESAADCNGQTSPIEPDVAVDPAAAAGVTTDYNDFTFAAGDDAAYDWAYTDYATLADFQAAVPQAVHDAVDPTADAKVFLTPAGVDPEVGTLSMDAQPVSTSLSRGTANVEAPGALATDYYGQSSYTDRGAIEYVTPALTAALTVYQTGGRTVEAYADESVDRNAYATYTYTWGDGSSTPSTTNAIVTHVYAAPGDYSVGVTVTDVFGDTSSTTVAATTAGSDYVPVTPSRVLDTRKGIGSGSVAPIGPGQTLALKITGLDTVPSTATAVALNLTATDATSGGHINAFPSGASVPVASNLDFVKGKNVANMAVVPVGTGGFVDFYNGSAGTVDLIADVSGYFVTAQADGYQQITPVRILDTRTTTGGHHAPLTPSDPIKLKVAGVGGIDGVPDDAKAVEVNLTVASGTANSLVTAYPDGTTKPTVSNLNFNAGQAIANAAIVPLGADGYIDIVTPVGSNRMVVDVDGYFSDDLTEAPSAYEPVTPWRYLDSRTIKNGQLTEYEYYELAFGRDFWGNIEYNTTGVVTNTTVTGVSAVSGDLDVFPDTYLNNGDLEVPTASSLNFTKGATVPNLVFATPADDGVTDFLNNSTGSLQLVVDVFGWFQSQ